VVVGVLAAFLIGAFALVVLGRDGGEDVRTTPIAVTTTLPAVTTSTLGVQEYTVQSGDTLVAIAERFGISVSTIQDTNEELTSPDALVVGQVLKIPPPRIPALVVVPATIEVGDTVRIKLTGAQAFEQITFEITSTAEQFTGRSHTATKGGKVITSYELAPDDVLGTYTVTADGDQGTTVQATFVVEASA
jgi:LysM repeat protein